MNCINPYGFATLALGALLSLSSLGLHAQNAVPQSAGPDLTRQQLAAFDQFLDSHPDLAGQIRKDPSLVNREEYVQSHPELQTYLQDHPGLREELTENPNAVMHQEQRFDRREERDQDRNRQDRDPDVTRRELANMDRFMESHPEVAEQLRKDPSLVDDKRFVGNHPALQEFLAQHPFVREEYKENPNGFMRQEQSFDRQQDSFMRRDRDVTRDELASFNEFMGDHNKIASEVSRHPSLATNEEYLENHPDLQQYLASHPKVQEGLRENPESFMKSAQPFETAPKATPKSATTEPKMK